MCCTSTKVFKRDSKSVLLTAISSEGYTKRSYATLYKQRPRTTTSNRPLHTSLLHIESNLYGLRLLSPTHGQSFQEQSGQITLQSVLVHPEFFKGIHTSCRNKELRSTDIHCGGDLALVKPARESTSSHPKPWAFLKKAAEI